jgi:hypothetical protein
MDVTWQPVSAEPHVGGGGDGGADVQHAAFISAVELSTASVVVHVGSIVHGGTQATTRHTIRPMQSICWLHCP